MQELKAESSLYGLLQGDTSSKGSGSGGFTINRVLAEGWMEKKGTGNGWFGSTTWKQRWVQLALTSIPGYDLDVPVLHVYWHDSLPVPSMSLNLEKTVVVAGYDGDKPIFNIIHVAQGGGGPNSSSSSNSNGNNAKENNNSMTPSSMLGFVPVDAAKQAALLEQQQKVTRTFGATSTGSLALEDCQEWVKHIAEAMHDYDKRKRDKKILDARPKGNKGALLPRSPTSARRRQMLKHNMDTNNNNIMNNSMNMNMSNNMNPSQQQQMMYRPSKTSPQRQKAPTFPQTYDL
jgi:hypothetical protein